MISIIICSKQIATDPILLQNIKDTIGTEYEVIHIDNSTNRYNIFEAYNQGVSQSHGEYLCFMHDDVIFHSKDWGTVVEKSLALKAVGALGVAGGCVVQAHTDWRFYRFHRLNYLIQGVNTVEENSQYYTLDPPLQTPYKRPLAMVAVLDGVWICIRRELFEQIRFDDVNYHDFHLYDSDICMQINTLGLCSFVTYDILLEHKSEGAFSAGFKENLEVFSNKWKEMLPLVKGISVSKNELEEALRIGNMSLDERLTQDAKLIAIRQLQKQKAAGEACRPYTADELKTMEASAYACRKQCIKDLSTPSQKVLNLIRSYMRLPYARRSTQLIIKFIWYRVLCMRHLIHRS